jgi:hypothetical protein
MRLFELFGPETEHKDERLSSDIDYVSDLKFFIDSDDELTSQSLFPAIKQHKKLGGMADQYQLYHDTVGAAIPKYCEQYDLNDIKEDIFTNEVIEAICKRFAEEQSKFIERGDYEN